MNDCELNEEIILMQAREIKFLRARNEELEKVSKNYATALSYLLEEVPCSCLEDEGECSGCKKRRKIEKMMGEK